MPDDRDGAGVQIHEDAVLEKWEGDPAAGGVLVEVVHVRDGQVIEVTHPNVDAEAPMVVEVQEHDERGRLQTRQELHPPVLDSSMGVVIPGA